MGAIQLEVSEVLLKTVPAITPVAIELKTAWDDVSVTFTPAGENWVAGREYIPSNAPFKTAL